VVPTLCDDNLYAMLHVNAWTDRLKMCEKKIVKLLVLPDCVSDAVEIPWKVIDINSHAARGLQRRFGPI
jgi:hypothetical protein